MNKIETSNHFDAWLDSLTDKIDIKSIRTRLLRLQTGNFGDCKSLGGGLYELRIDWAAGYRVYFIQREKTLYFILNGGNKSSQNRDIEKAKELQKSF